MILAINGDECLSSNVYMDAMAQRIASNTLSLEQFMASVFDRTSTGAESDTLPNSNVRCWSMTAPMRSALFLEAMYPM